MRHTAAALMIAEGAHLLVVKERLGHSTIAVTADRYGHLYPSLSASLTNKLDAVYQAAHNPSDRPDDRDCSYHRRCRRRPSTIVVDHSPTGTALCTRPP